MGALSSFLGTVWDVHIHPLRGVASGQSVCLRCHNDDGSQRPDAAQLPAGAPADPAGGEAGVSAEQRAHSVQVSTNRRAECFAINIIISDYACICLCGGSLLPHIFHFTLLIR